MLQDTTGRGIGYLRLSLTKACSMRCTYCRPTWLEQPRGEPVLTPQELEQIARHLARHHGLRKVRLTGGDPTSRPELVEIIRRIASIEGIDDLAMTTNGLTLVRMAQQYADAGLKRINLSMDSLDPDRFARMTGVNGLARVLEGIDAAHAAGLGPIKINAVVLRGENDQELPDLVRFAAKRGVVIRFIELMPMGPLASSWAERYVPEQAMRDAIAPIVRDMQPLEQGHDAARRYRMTLDDGSTAEVGFITPMSCNFCAQCNRMRITANGELYPCLMDEPRGSLLDAVRPVFDGHAVDQAIQNSLEQKQAEHPHDGFVTMTHIGG
ncbi:MAG: GTP 3',8-cyclase MoaA [Phycisphaerales bacterium JB063]